MLGHKNTECHFSSGGNIEEIDLEFNLSANIAYPDPFNLSLPDHVHGLITADGPSRRVETEVVPFPSDFDVGFINAVGVIGQSQVKTNSFLQLRSISLNPPVNRPVID